jgi:hypothetical protein
MNTYAVAAYAATLIGKLAPYANTFNGVPSHIGYSDVPISLYEIRPCNSVFGQNRTLATFSAPDTYA